MTDQADNVTHPSDIPAGPPRRPEQPRLVHGRLAIRATMPHDCQFVLAVEAHPDNAPHVGQWTLERHLACLEGPSDAHWVIEHAGQPIGYMIIEDADDPDHSLLLRRIAIASKGRGHGRNAVTLAARYCFDVLRFHRLWLYVALHNKRASSLYRKLGFVQEGVARECSREGDHYVSMRIMSLLEHEYRAGIGRPHDTGT